MKQFVTLLAAILIAIALYTVYGLLTFQPDEPKPFVFSDPVLPPEIIAEQKEVEASTLNAAEEQQKQMALGEAQKAFDLYKSYEETASQQVKDTLTAINTVMASWLMPAYFLSAPNPLAGGQRNFEKLKIEVSNSVSLDTTQKTLNCAAKTPAASIVIGSTGPDILGCDVARDITGQKGDADVILIGGPDNDTINDAVGNRIVNGGTGDDTITLAAGRSIVVLDAAWGHDTLTIDCTGANIAPNEVPRGFPIPWLSKTSNFIVLGDGVEPKDVVWKANVLTNVASGDTLTVNENCLTVVPSAQ